MSIDWLQALGIRSVANTPIGRGIESKPSTPGNVMNSVTPAGESVGLKIVTVIINNIKIAVQFQDYSDPNSTGSFYGMTRKISDTYYYVSINVNPSIPKNRVAAAIVHEFLHCVNWEAALFDDARHKACHYLACAITSGWSAAALKLKQYEHLLSEIRSQARICYRLFKEIRAKQLSK